MTFFTRFASMLNWILRRRRAEARLDEELQTFLDMSAAQKMRDGANEADARRLARLELGGVEQVKEQVRARRHGGCIDEAARDMRYALRIFARNRAFTLVVLITLALGIGANTAIFTLIDALMLRSLPVDRPSELVLLQLRERGDVRPGGESFSYDIVRALDNRRDIFNGVAGFSSLNVTVGRGDSLKQIRGAVVTGSYYSTLGLRPVLGRLLTPEDDQPGAPVAAVISEGYWEREYGRSPSVIGQVIRANGGLALTIVGVSPAEFNGADAASVANITTTVSSLPVMLPANKFLLGPGVFWLRALARPARGLTAESAAARINAAWPGLAETVIAPQWSAARKKTMAESVFSLSPGATGWTGLRDIYRRPLFALMAVAGLVLLIACANVASLLLARASSRQREIAVRLAIGAGRARIVRQLMTEGLMLSFAGAALGLGVAVVSSRFLVDLISSGPREVQFDLTPNAHVLLFSALAAVVTGVIFGIAPAF